MIEARKFIRVNSVAALMLILLVSCETSKAEKADKSKNLTEKQLKFDPEKWSAKKDNDYVYREAMLNDVLYNDEIRALSKEGIIVLLGAPDRIKDGHMYYVIRQDRLGFWPLHTKTMVIKLKADESVEWIKLHE